MNFSAKNFGAHPDDRPQYPGQEEFPTSHPIDGEVRGKSGAESHAKRLDRWSVSYDLCPEMLRRAEDRGQGIGTKSDSYGIFVEGIAHGSSHVYLPKFGGSVAAVRLTGPAYQKKLELDRRHPYVGVIAPPGLGDTRYRIYVQLAGTPSA